jgi:cytoplasmic iron level regulating protein YaaA (DUF328/UPF0246 family)
MLTLLSPAKTLDFSPAPDGLATTEPRFGRDIQVLMKRCKKLDVAALRKLMSLSQPLAELNRQRFQAMRWPFPPGTAKPCLLAFRGDVYRRLDADSLSAADLAWAQDHVRILSGLYGLLRPLDLIQPYRLEMGTQLDTGRGGDLYAFWGERLVDSLNAEHAERPVAAVLNLASNEYAKAVPTGRLEPPMVTAVFQERRDGKPKTIALLAKKARGLMARWVIDNRIEDPADLRDFAEQGYRFASRPSAGGRLVFIRPDSR